LSAENSDTAILAAGTRNRDEMQAVQQFLQGVLKSTSHGQQQWVFIAAMRFGGAGFGPVWHFIKKQSPSCLKTAVMRSIAQ